MSTNYQEWAEKFAEIIDVLPKGVAYSERVSILQTAFEDKVNDGVLTHEELTKLIIAFLRNTNETSRQETPTWVNTVASGMLIMVDGEFVPDDLASQLLQISGYGNKRTPVVFFSKNTRRQWLTRRHYKLSNAHTIFTGPDAHSTTEKIKMMFVTMEPMTLLQIAFLFDRAVEMYERTARIVTIISKCPSIISFARLWNHDSKHQTKIQLLDPITREFVQ